MQVNLTGNSPLVSIVIPAYNRESYIEEAILSAINQTYSNIEIIIGDNQSTDRTWEILKKWSLKDDRIRIFRNDENLGPVLNWSECFKRASGTYTKILWSDDWMSPDFIEKALNSFDDNIAFVISGQQITTGKEVISEISYKRKLYSQKEYLNDILLFGNKKFPVSPGCAIFRTKDLVSSLVVDIDNADFLNSRMNGAGNDLLLFLKISLGYEYVATLPNIDSFFRYHQGSFSVANNLFLYYEWAKVYFVKNNEVPSRLVNSLKSLLFLKRVRMKHSYNNIFHSIHYMKWPAIDVLVFCFLFFFNKLFRRFL